MRDRFCPSSVYCVQTEKQFDRETDMDEIQLARTESVFREVNEAIAKTAEKFEADEADFVCECGDPDCAYRLTASLEAYEEVRADGAHFIVAPGHGVPRLERLVRSGRGYHVIEKLGTTLARTVRRLNPRLQSG
jgi:hypothetical protein